MATIFLLLWLIIQACIATDCKVAKHHETCFTACKPKANIDVCASIFRLPKEQDILCPKQNPQQPQQYKSLCGGETPYKRCEFAPDTEKCATKCGKSIEVITIKKMVTLHDGTEEEVKIRKPRICAKLGRHGIEQNELNPAGQCDHERVSFLKYTTICGPKINSGLVKKPKVSKVKNKELEYLLAICSKEIAEEDSCIIPCAVIKEDKEEDDHKENTCDKEFKREIINRFSCGGTAKMKGKYKTYCGPKKDWLLQHNPEWARSLNGFSHKYLNDESVTKDESLKTLKSSLQKAEHTKSFQEYEPSLRSLESWQLELLLYHQENEYSHSSYRGNDAVEESLSGSTSSNSQNSATLARSDYSNWYGYNGYSGYAKYSDDEYISSANRFAVINSILLLSGGILVCCLFTLITFICGIAIGFLMKTIQNKNDATLNEENAV